MPLYPYGFWLWSNSAVSRAHQNGCQNQNMCLCVLEIIGDVLWRGSYRLLAWCSATVTEAFDKAILIDHQTFL